MTKTELQQVRTALADILSGWDYIQAMHGRLSGVGWDRCGTESSTALAILDAELAKPEAREWGMSYIFGPNFNRDGFGEDGP